MYCEDVATAKPHNWITVAFQPLPAGWFHVFDFEGFDGDTTRPDCPGVLVQELRSRDVFSGGRYAHTEHLEPPYQTRVVFAEHYEGILVPAADNQHYVSTCGPNDEVPK